jgi:exopolyphosphatase/guanosine-5'-triphosphate,3'-diphosphate pyrophosphatase
VAERVAVVDIGSNSTRLLIAELAGGRVLAELARRSEVTRLGAGVDAGGRLSEEGIERVLQALDRYHAEIEAAGVQRALAVLTSAVRDSCNGAAFAQRVHDRYGLQTHILSGEQEARLTYLGAVSERAGRNGRVPRTLVLDIGGGSTELVIGLGREVGFHASTPIGVVRQAERHLRSDPPSETELRAVADDVRGLLSQAVPVRERAVDEAIAVAGTPTSLAAIAQELEPYDPERVHGYRLSRGQWEGIMARLSRMTRFERERVPGLAPTRAATILPGIVILSEVTALFGLDEVEASEHDILRGAALGL